MSALHYSEGLHKRVMFSGQEFWLDGRGVLYWPLEQMLVFSDLHLEKASFLARFGAPLPQYDSLDTVQRMEQIIAEYTPRSVLCLGDSFHDAQAFERLGTDERKRLENLVRGVSAWHWVEGNHDSAVKNLFGAASLPHYRSNGMLFTHQPISDNIPQIIGHFHPKVTVLRGNQKIRGRCFLIAEKTLIMPAFGTFTGGLSYPHPSYAQITAETFQTYLLYREKVFPV